MSFSLMSRVRRLRSSPRVSGSSFSLLSAETRMQTQCVLQNLLPPRGCGLGGCHGLVAECLGIPGLPSRGLSSKTAPLSAISHGMNWHQAEVRGRKRTVRSLASEASPLWRMRACPGTSASHYLPVSGGGAPEEATAPSLTFLMLAGQAPSSACLPVMGPASVRVS